MSTAGVEPISAEGGHRDRLLFHASWVLGVELLGTVGWLVMAPLDPRGAMSIWSHAQPMVMMLETALLLAVASGLAAALAARVHATMGAFAVGLGLTVASLRGESMAYLMLSHDGSVSLALKALLEGAYWSVVMGVALVVSLRVARWLRGGMGDAFEGVGRVAWPTVGKHLAVSVVVGLVLIRVFSSGGIDRAVRNGQACFAVAAGLYIAAGRAQALFPVRSAVWAWLAVPVVCVLAYLLSLLSGVLGTSDGLASTPESAFMRILPVTYVGLGTSATLLAFWRTDSGAARAGGD